MDSRVAAPAAADARVTREMTSVIAVGDMPNGPALDALASSVVGVPSGRV